VQLLGFALTVVLLGAGPDAPPVVHPSAEAEVEEVLAAAARKSPLAAVVVVLEGPDPKVYQLEEVAVRLDGAPVAVSVAAPSGPARKGTEVSDGDHVLSARLVYRGQAFGPYPWEAGPRWALPARVLLKASHGLRLTIRLIVETNEHAPQAGQRLALRAEVEPEMLVAVDDAPLPPPPLPELPPAAQAPVTASVVGPSAALAVELPPAAPPKKKRKKTVARSPRPSAVAPSSSSAAAAPPAAATPKVPTAEASEGLEQATARLRSALAAPRDGGPAPH
jgi:hypothetical protein